MPLIRLERLFYRRSSTLSLGGFAIAIIGAFVSFLPLLQILLPLKAVAISPRAPASLIGPIAALGAAVAGLGNIAVGWLSDRTRSRFGRRRPWLIAGVLGVLLSYWLIGQARQASALLGGVVLFQLAFNMMFSPLLALVPDRVPAHHRGLASAIIAMGNPVGTLVGTVVIGSLFAREDDRLLVLAVIVTACVVPFAVRLGADAPPVPAVSQAAGVSLTRDFVLGCLARACVIVAFTVTQLYLLFYVGTLPGHGQPHGAERAMSLLGVVFGLASTATAIIAGLASDRIGRRKPFVIAGAGLVGGGMLGLALAPSWPAAVAAYALFAMGAGIHMAVEFALMVDILPSHRRAARDLGLLNLANIVPQIVASLGLTWLLALPGASLQWGFAAGGLAAALGGILVAFIRSAS